MSQARSKNFTPTVDTFSGSVLLPDYLTPSDLTENAKLLEFPTHDDRRRELDPEFGRLKHRLEELKDPPDFWGDRTPVDTQVRDFAEHVAMHVYVWFSPKWQNRHGKSVFCAPHDGGIIMEWTVCDWEFVAVFSSEGLSCNAEHCVSGKEQSIELDPMNQLTIDTFLKWVEGCVA